MRIGAAGNHAEAFLRKPAASACAFRITCSIGHELRRQRFEETDCLGGDDMDQRSALHAGEHGLVDGRAVLFIAPGSFRERGPRNVLCVVDVTMSACSQGFG